MGRLQFVISLLGLLIGLAPAPSACQDQAPVPATRPAPNRWDREIDELVNRAALRSTSHAEAVFIGSSSIRLWNLADSFPELNAINQGFGGSHLADSVAFFERLVTPHTPRVIVLYAGDNDLSAGLSPQQVAEDFRQFLAKVEKSTPRCERVIFIAIKPSTARWHLREQIGLANRLVADSCAASPRAVFADIWPPTLAPEGEPRRDLLQADGLHLNSAGYEIWTAVVGQQLAQVLSPPATEGASCDLECPEFQAVPRRPASHSRFLRAFRRLLR